MEVGQGRARRRATAEPTVPKPSNATRQRTKTSTSLSPSSPPGGSQPGQELAPEPRRDAVAWLPWRHRAGPSATLDEARLSVVPATIANRRGQIKSMYTDTWITPSTRRPSPPARTRAASPRSTKSAGTASPGCSRSRSASGAFTASSSMRAKNANADLAVGFLLRVVDRDQPLDRLAESGAPESSRPAGRSSRRDRARRRRPSRSTAARPARRPCGRCPGSRSWRCDAGRSRSGSR